MVISCGDRILADKVQRAASFVSRFRGLMGKAQLETGAGLLLMDCPAIHCFFMKIPIDAVYLSREMEVLTVETLPPWRIGKRVPRAAHVLELAAGTAWLAAGDRLRIQE